MLSVALAWIAFPFQPIAVWIGGERTEPAFRRVAEGFEFEVGGQRRALYVDATAAGFALRVSPPEAIAISFRISGPHSGVRSESDGRVYQFALGRAQSRLNDALAPDEAGPVWRFVGSAVEVYGGDDSGAGRIEFSRSGEAAIERAATRGAALPEGADVVPAILLRAVAGERGSLIVRADGGADKAAACGAALALWGGSPEWSPTPDAPDWVLAAQKTGSRPELRRADLRFDGLPEVYVVHAGRANDRYASVTVYNRFDRARTVVVTPQEVGLDPVRSHALYDFLSSRPLGVALGPIGLYVPAFGVRTVLIRQWQDRPMVLGCLESMFGEATISSATKWDEAKLTLSGEVVSNGVANVIVYPYLKGRPLEFVRLEGGTATASEHRVRITIDGRGRRAWSVRFGRGTSQIAAPKVSATHSSPSPWIVSHLIKYENAAGAYLKVNDQPVCYVADSVCVDDATTPLSEYTYSFTPSAHGGEVSSATLVTARPGWPESMNLGKVPISDYGPPHISPRVNTALDGTFLSIGGRPAFGLSIAAGGFVETKLFRAFSDLRFRLRSAGAVRILGDGAVLWEGSGGEDEASLNLDDVLLLRIESERSEAQLLDPLITAKPRPSAGLALGRP